MSKALEQVKVAALESGEAELIDAEFGPSS